MGSKKEWLLDAFIKTYLYSHAPVGSESLRLALQGQAVHISSATIRNYFKRLTSEGAICQSHSSSGRIPTTRALKDYWRAKLTLGTPLEVDLDKLQRASEHYGIFSMVERYQKAVLQAVHNHERQFLILDFGNTQALLPYNKKLEGFVRDLIGLECKAIQQLALSVCATSLAKQIDHLCLEKLYFGLCALGQLVQSRGAQKLFRQILEGSLLRGLEQGLHFEKVLPLGFLGVLCPIKLKGEQTRMLCVGGLEQDFEGFYGAIGGLSI
ncbi:HrcA family transcriptional regulator [Helicobacter ailurogastricus]|uniref:Heat-inducible transcription repressor HrcA n=1 Tax=Helicobacter ailurogastricus TaxID=1578720 RepID=A0A0K2XBL2_9HELI|nr:HrcA family transcriptional regulator [Helicobacter ailurogastricus]CRF40483.1 Heat-inducible transcription repressor HrcA [Helicobacter ailurogastricus]CRF43456.1 Heat-inducible transcription repressor HrcA [Helicobacter ailurogastricus]CRF44009.1 Heat-inducible transcription repressor HrcA [Helicobacter ailurogastricus]CRF52501.1 Heat-inducible transcription repressor HrcA [Helicobacter ailurogastricus]GLH58197.1 Heat-inducible transcription repressor HrcA [Helicobacter ailurogastricus]